jgi:putative redox protein
MPLEVETRSLDDQATAVGAAGPYTVIINRPARAGGTGDPAVWTEITYEVDVEGDAPAERLRALVEDIDRIAEIPNSLRGGTRVRLTGTNAVPTPT